jgi:hypothetical protein
MITAKNYAAQAARGLDRIVSALIGKGCQGDAANVERVIKLMNMSTHFAVPDGGLLLHSKDFNALADIPFRMPYPTITIEFATPGKIITKHLIVAAEVDITNPVVQKAMCGQETDSKIATIVMSMVFQQGVWSIVPTGFVMLDRSEVSDNGKLISFYPFTTLPQLLKQITDVGQDNYLDISKSHVTPLCEFIAALSCTNVGTETHQEGYRDNTKRIAKGKLPIYETKVLTLNVTSAQKGGKGGGGSSTPKRQHFRRGHIFKCHGKNTWRNACLVGKNHDGFIDKDYRLT